MVLRLRAIFDVHGSYSLNPIQKVSSNPVTLVDACVISDLLLYDDDS